MNNRVNPEPPKKQRSSLRAVLLLLLVFLLGFGFGAGGVLLGFRHMARNAFAASPKATAPIDRFLAAVEARFTRKLALTPAERAAAHEELAITAREFKRDRETFLTATRNLVNDTIFRIGQRLPPEKRDRLEELARARLEPWGIRLEDSPPAATTGSPPSAPQ